jgi:hypothetical protein
MDEEFSDAVIERMLDRIAMVGDNDLERHQIYRYRLSKLLTRNIQGAHRLAHYTTHIHALSNHLENELTHFMHWEKNRKSIPCDVVERYALKQHKTLTDITMQLINEVNFECQKCVGLRNAQDYAMQIKRALAIGQALIDEPEPVNPTKSNRKQRRKAAKAFKLKQTLEETECIICFGEIDRDDTYCINATCGHILYCESCAKTANDRPQVFASCPVCQIKTPAGAHCVPSHVAINWGIQPKFYT